MATTAAYNEFVRVYSDPEGTQTRGQYQSRAGHYMLMWQRYSNALFDNPAAWTAYKTKYRIYRNTRSIYNPARRLVDFYSAIVYPGFLTSDGKPLPDGTPTAIPLAPDTPPQLTAAVGQLWQWSNWQTGKGLLPRYGAALGDVLLEVVDDTERGKVTLDVIWPGLVTALELDMYGNVKGYTIEYTYEDKAANKVFAYKREVDSEKVSTYRDNKPWAYSEDGWQYDNPYGFVPACWVQHVNTGGDHGEPALRNVAAIDELNSLASDALDQGHRILNSPILIAGEGIAGLDENTKGDTTNAQEPRTRSREGIHVIRGAAGSTVNTLRLEPGEALALIERLVTMVESDHPELSMYTQLRSMGQVTGPAADRLFGDVQGLVDAARANYDTQSIKAFQMAVAIGGWRANSGAWGPTFALTRQQQAFVPFNLESFTAGDLDLEIMPRPLVAITERERLEIERLRASVQSETTPAPTLAQGIADRLRVAGNGAPVPVQAS